MIRWLCRRILYWELHEEFVRGWKSGVDQQRLDPESCEHHVTDLSGCWGEY